MDRFLEGLERQLASAYLIVYAPAAFALRVWPRPAQDARSTIDELIRGFLWPLVSEGRLKQPIMNRVRRMTDAPVVPFRMLVCPLSSEKRVHGFIASFRTHDQIPFSAEDLAILSASTSAATRSLIERLEVSTGLLSRPAFESEVEHCCQSSGTASVVYANLDQVHVINELAGFAAGDKLIREVGRLWQAELLPIGGFASHLSGDRFAAVLPDHTLNQARTWAEKVRLGTSRLDSGNPQTQLSVSLGVSTLDDAGSLQHALAAAETACRVAKDRGRNRVEVYATGDNTVMRRHEEVYESRVILEALEQDRFTLHAQPIVALDGSSAVNHHEILLRLQGEDGTEVSIAGFIAAAERYQLLERLDRWVVSRVISRLAAISQALRSQGVSFTVNVTGQSIGESDFADFVRAEIRKNEIPAGLIDFEITETAALRNPKATARFISRMKDIGSRIALDDFGTGLSSLVHLKDLDVYRIKIDGQFVRDVLSNGRSRALIRALAQIAQEIGMETVAEFVETAEVAARLRELGVDFGQGYFFDRPRLLDEVLKDLSGCEAPVERTTRRRRVMSP